MILYITANGTKNKKNQRLGDVPQYFCPYTVYIVYAQDLSLQ